MDTASCARSRFRTHGPPESGVGRGRSIQRTAEPPPSSPLSSMPDSADGGRVGMTTPLNGRTVTANPNSSTNHQSIKHHPTTGPNSFCSSSQKHRRKPPQYCVLDPGTSQTLTHGFAHGLQATRGHGQASGLPRVIDTSTTRTTWSQVVGAVCLQIMVDLAFAVVLAGGLEGEQLCVPR
jgi:hypothetical protein